VPRKKKILKKGDLLERPRDEDIQMGLTQIEVPG
jgi:hypothetical protein